MKLIAVETCTKDFINGFIELEDDYARFTIHKGRPAEIGARFQKIDFETHVRFVSVMGKFLPTFIFLRKPISIRALDDLLWELVERTPAFQVCR